MGAVDELKKKRAQEKADSKSGGFLSEVGQFLFDVGSGYTTDGSGAGSPSSEQRWQDKINFSTPKLERRARKSGTIGAP